MLTFNKTLRSGLILLLVSISFVVLGNTPQALGKTRKEPPKEVYQQANDLLKAEKWKEAYLLYQRLLKDYKKTSFVRRQKKEIKIYFDQCAQKLGIVTDIDQVFKGKATLTEKYRKKYLELFYDFSQEEQIDDFINISADDLKQVNEALEARGAGGYYFFNLKDVVFVNEVTIEFTMMIVPPTNQEAAVYIFYDPDKQTGYLFGLRYKEYQDDPVARDCVRLIAKYNTGQTKNLWFGPKTKIKPGETYQVKITALNGSLRFYLNNKPLHGPIKNKQYQRGLVRFGGYNSRVRYDNLRIKGVIDPEWLDKAFSEATTKALAAQEEDLETEIPEDETDKLSAEAEDILAQIPEAALKTYYAGKKRMRTFPKRIRNLREVYQPIKKAIQLFDKAMSHYNDPFAAAYYQRALCRKLLGEDKKALADFTKAIEIFPEFYEAYAQRGDIYLSRLKYEESLAEYEKAIEVDPEYSYGYSGRGYLRFILGKREEALADIDKAVALDPDNQEAKDYQRNLKHVIKGPLWPISYEKETEHYSIKTDISQEKCDIFAGHLETMYDYYAKILNHKEPVRKKNRVYIFNTKEGYQTYACLSTDDSAAYTLGYYHPHYRELLVFEQVGKQEECRNVLYHEGFHMFVHEIVEDIPIWFNEGFAEYFNGTKIERRGSKWVITKKGLSVDRLETIQQGIQMGAMTSFEEIMNETQGEFYAQAWVRYAQAWSMIHFFMQHKNGIYKRDLLKYFEVLKGGKSQREAFDGIYAKKDITKLEKEWMRYVKKLRKEKK